jgi:exoribonuclease-2
MLPLEATRRLGLGLEDVSPALSLGLSLGPDGEILDLDPTPSWVRVTRLTYAEAQSRLAEEPFCSLYKLAQRYQARRHRNGAILIDLPEVKIQVQEGQVSIYPLPTLRSRDLVTEAMLMAGEAVARYGLERGIPLPFSTQDPPAPGAPQQPEDLAGMYALRRALQRSQLKSMPTPHAGLGMDVYTQATSPLRRYLDLVTHQQLRAFLAGEQLLEPHEILERIGAAEAVMGDVRRAERLARRHWTLVYLMQHPDWRGHGVLVDRIGSRGILLIPDLDLEPRVHVPEDLPLNSLLLLAPTGVDLPELKAHFRIVSA